MYVYKDSDVWRLALFVPLSLGHTLQQINFFFKVKLKLTIEWREWYNNNQQIKTIHCEQEYINCSLSLKENYVIFTTSQHFDNPKSVPKT